VTERNLLDSFAALAFLKKESKYQAVIALFNEAKEGKRHLLMNQINAGEVYYQVLRRRLVDDIDTFWRTFLLLPVEFVANDFDLVLDAARIKSRYAISFADCFAVATALREKATIVTGDPEFKQVQKVVRIDWM
jgi:uncharacterized protein